MDFKPKGSPGYAKLRLAKFQHVLHKDCDKHRNSGHLPGIHELVDEVFALRTGPFRGDLRITECGEFLRLANVES